MYNLRVAEYHTYFVGSTEWGFGVWVHNAEYAVEKGGRLLKDRANAGVKEVAEIITNATTQAASDVAALTNTSALTGSRRTDLYLNILRAKNGTPLDQLPGGVKNLVEKFTSQTTGAVNWSALEAMTKGGAIQSKVNMTLKLSATTSGLINDGKLILDHGSELGLRSQKGNLLRPDYQMKLESEGAIKWAIFDITTIGEAGKIVKYDHRNTQYLIEVLY